ncbi:hypothetical protein GpartN1_g757.t1 [Galdieria partita]|uniref:Histidine biosynthesis bifunctional protein HisIE n=1 Tax=Galdieria partita TaxID=83374 RepID=A0A9C7UN23_9RHOD|nr:hypothetical protein GpartN1_g757.t1 [Galdieria partita]
MTWAFGFCHAPWRSKHLASYPSRKSFSYSNCQNKISRLVNGNLTWRERQATLHLCATQKSSTLLERVKFDRNGLIPVIAQQYDTQEVLMLAWMDREALLVTIKEGRVCYYSRSRNSLWRKGETSGQVQWLKDIYIDCDGDSVLLKVDQMGVACHTGRRSCFFNKLNGEDWEIVSPVETSPEVLYGRNSSALKNP